MQPPMVSAEYAQARLTALKQFDDTMLEPLRRDRERLYEAQRVLVALRRRLREFDPSLPDEYDGNAWFRIEQEWLR